MDNSKNVAKIMACVIALSIGFSSSHIYAQTPAVSSATNSRKIAGHSTPLPAMKGQNFVGNTPLVRLKRIPGF